MSSWTTERARLAGTLRHNPAADTTELRRDLRAARGEDYIRRLVAAAPPLSAEQRARIAVILLGGDAP